MLLERLQSRPCKRLRAVYRGAVTIIKNDEAQLTFGFTGSALPYGAAVTVGVDIVAYAGSALALAELAGSYWGPILSHLGGSVRLVEVTAKFGPSSTGASASYDPDLVGSSADCANGATAILVQKLTNTGGRQGKGRFFLPCPADSDTSNGIVSPSSLAALQTDLDDFYEGMLDADAPLVVLHTNPATAASPILSLHAAPRVATVRRRNRR